MANWPTSGTTASRSTATRFTPGAISLSNSSHFAKSSDVAAWAREAVNEAGADRIRHQHENDRHGASYLLQRSSGLLASGQDYVRRERDQFGRILRKTRHIAQGEAVVDPHIAALDPAQLLQSLQDDRIS